ncbi:ACT domain-containing protein [Longispora sp. K20-0274]|uniref:ACT domain-containing protein n=1 Tax=Longispora sp. K20-0274 TaxID=3088255 RepID=UPI00399A4CB5
MIGERDLSRLLSGLEPELHPGRYVFVSVPGKAPADVHPIVTVTEDDGTTLVLSRAEADTHHLEYDLVMAWITLTVHSALDAVGLTAAVATALAGEGIPCNMVAGYYHDHVFVPHDDAARAMEALRALASTG